MKTIEMRLDRWAEEMKALGYSEDDIFFAISIKHQTAVDADLVEEARLTFGQKAADELAEMRAKKIKTYRASVLHPVS